MVFEVKMIKKLKKCDVERERRFYVKKKSCQKGGPRGAMGSQKGVRRAPARQLPSGPDRFGAIVGPFWVNLPSFWALFL